jgi:c-di-GMP-binding flagellar brake protein YcgR
MEKEERETNPLFRLVNVERRRHPRFSIDLPVEYWQINNCKSRPSRTVDVSEGGLLVHLSEQLEVGQNLRLNLFIDSGPDLDSIEALVQVVWKDIHGGKDGDFRTGVKFADISAEDMGKLKNFLNALMNLQVPSELKIPPKFVPILANFSTRKPPKPKMENPG